MKPVLKYWTFLFAIIAAIFAVLLGSFAGSWYSLDPAEREMVRGLFNKLIPFPFLGGLALVMIIGTLVSLLFRFYIIPVLLLAEKARLITTVNPAYRIVPTGAREIAYLSEVINDSAEAYQKLQTEVNEQIRVAKNELHEERNRLAALMAEIPCGVLVCNISGQILLYNPQAQTLLQTDNGSHEKIRQGSWVGLGRSVFGVLSRDLIVNSLEWLQQAINKGQKTPVSRFMTTLQSGTCLRVNMTPVFKHHRDRHEMSGFVLSLEDMTRQIEANSRLDILIQSLTKNLQKPLDQIRSSILTILQTPGMDPEQLNSHRKNIDKASLELQQQLFQTNEEYTRHQQETSRFEDVLADDLLQILQKSLKKYYSIEVLGHADTGLHLQVDSYSFIQSISHLAGVLRIHENITDLFVEIHKTALDQAIVNLSWGQQDMPEHLVKDWEEAPLITDRYGLLLSFLDMVTKQGGNIERLPSGTTTCRGVNITLPASHKEARLEIPDQPEARPVNYEFDLFDQKIGAETAKQPLRECTFVVFDTETTGLSPSDGDEIIQIGGIRIVRGRLLHNETIDQLVDPQRSVPSASVEIHGIDPALLVGQPTIEQVLPRFHKFAEGAVLVAHNAAFDMKFLQIKQARAGVRFDQPVLDTLLLSSIVHPTWGTHSLDEIADRMNVTIVGRHTALGDAIVTAEILLKLIPLLQAKGIYTLEEARRASSMSQYAKMNF
jgi:DNA polymerase-3 subunit epsilon